jgi:hypothetical protein
MYEIELTPEAVEDLAAFRKFDQVRIVAGMEAQLKHEPATETRIGSGFGQTNWPSGRFELMTSESFMMYCRNHRL